MKFVVFLCMVSMAVAVPFSAYRTHINDNERIIGGVHAEKGEIPYQVSLQKGNPATHFCGGVIYNRRYIITAAHCVSGESYTNVKARIGSIHHNSDGEIYSLEKIISHPNYDSWTMDFDVALLKTSLEMKLSPIAGKNSIPLVASGFNYQYKEIEVSGWGYTRENGQTIPTDLMKITLGATTMSNCNSSYSGQITDRMFCAGPSAGGKGTCQGDSGGPATVVDGGVRKLVGITSWGYGCARPNYPAIFASIPSLANWFKQNAI